VCGLDQRCLGPGYYWMGGDRLRAGKPPVNGFFVTRLLLCSQVVMAEISL